MQQQFDNHIFTGMQRDLSISKHPANYLFDALNIRITARDNNTLLSITNERGPKYLNINVSGTYLGHCVLNEFLIVFSTESTIENDIEILKTDYITKINLRTNETTNLYSGQLNFLDTNKIEAIGSYENKTVLKVYWTDGRNLPRMINICDDIDTRRYYNNSSFDFIPTLSLKETIQCTPLYGSGEFPAGVILYAFTYYNKFGVESNIFYTTPLYYIKFKDRGASPEEKVNISFKLSIDNPDANFDYLRVYSILRTSINATPITKKVRDIELNKKLLKRIISTGELFNLSKWIPDIDNKEDVLNPITSITDITVFTHQSSYTLTPDKLIPFTNLTELTSKYHFSIEVLDILNLNFAGKASDTSYYTEITQANKILVKHRYYIPLSLNTKVLIVWTPKDTIIITASDSIQPNEFITEYRMDEYSARFLTCTDSGTIGEDVDSTELLYKGGESIIALTLELKDNTLFLGNITLQRKYLNIQEDLLPKDGNNINPDIKSCLVAHSNILECLAGFKSYEYYRLGIQFLYKTGKWAEPYWIGDSLLTELNYEKKEHTIIKEGIDSTVILISNDYNERPAFSYKLPDNIIKLATANDYIKVRPILAIPTANDRTRICLGIICPTMYTYEPSSTTEDKIIKYQSSWLYRTHSNEQGTGSTINLGGIVTNDLNKKNGNNRLRSIFEEPIALSYKPTTPPDKWLLNTEIMGYYKEDLRFYIDDKVITFNTADLLDDTITHYDYTNTSLEKIGSVILKSTSGSIDIQAGAPLGSDAGGVLTYKIQTSGYGALIAGGFYNDRVIDDDSDGKIFPYWEYNSNPEKAGYAINFPVFMWHRNGSLNNDIPRAGRSAELIKKRISNHRYGETYYNVVTPMTLNSQNNYILLFNSNLLSLLKLNNANYFGNVDTLLNPDKSRFPLMGSPVSKKADVAKDESKWVLSNESEYGYLYYDEKDEKWKDKLDEILTPNWLFGETYQGLISWSEGVRMKYKSSPHFVCQLLNSLSDYWTIVEDKERSSLVEGELVLADIISTYNKDTLYGGVSKSALLENLWIPCGEPVLLPEDNENTNLTLIYSRGDTYFLNFECLKTYAFTPEDVNQVVEVASYNCETRINLLGRYDKNQNLEYHLGITPEIFNLINPIYSLLDNFFNYRILSESYYKIKSFPNLITWTKEKQAGADIDTWTNITLASTYDIDGSKGEIVSLNTWKDTIYCFLNKGISNILFNSRVQIPSSDGIPIEITNNYKVDGYRYLSDGTGCSNKWTIKETPTGVYFIDTTTNNLYSITDKIENISASHNMVTWIKDKEILKTLYDDINHDLYLISSEEALCYSEVLLQFTSRMSYGNMQLLESYHSDSANIIALHNSKLYLFNGGKYNTYFDDTYQPWFILFISNGVNNLTNNSTLDKVFDNIEYRMDRYSFKSNVWNTEHLKSLDYIRVYNEYLDTDYVTLSNIKNIPSNLKKKFRVWRITIPRHADKILYTDLERAKLLEEAQKETPNITLEDIPTVKRIQRRDRIRNTWCNIELGIKETNNTDKVELHDINVIYYM